MITIPALRLKQFGMEFYQAALSSEDVSRLVEFVVLGSGLGPKRRRPRAKGRPRVHWDLLESLVKTGDTAYQRPLIRKKLESLVEYYRECAEEERVPLPAIPGAVILVSQEKLEFSPSSSNPSLGRLQIPEQRGLLHALDGQHRLVALQAGELPETAGELQVPAVIFDRLEPAQEVEMFATINCKQTKLNPSLLVSLSGRRLYADPKEVLAHEVARKLNEDPDSPLLGEIKMLGVGKGRVPQSSFTRAVMEFLGQDPPPIKDPEQARQFLVKYFKQLGRAFPDAWAGRKYSIKSPIALRAFLLAAPAVIARIKQERADLTDALVIRKAIEPWTAKITSDRFWTEGEWQRKLAPSARRSAEILARELKEALESAA